MSESDEDVNAGTSSLAKPHPSLHVVVLKFPPFWASDPQMWFAQVEAQYAHVISSLQPEVAQKVRDLLLFPPKDKPYATLKETLIQRTSASEQRRVQLLLNEEVLGDRKPTQLLSRMQQFFGGAEDRGRHPTSTIPTTPPT